MFTPNIPNKKKKSKQNIPKLSNYGILFTNAFIANFNPSDLDIIRMGLMTLAILSVFNLESTSVCFPPTSKFIRDEIAIKKSNALETDRIYENFPLQRKPNARIFVAASTMKI